ncbi:MAG: hypothetical protein AAF266_05270 [Planctomycetota bacterium]
MLRTSLLSLASVAVVCLGGTGASAQVDLQLLTTLDGFTLSTGNPGSVAAYGDTLYVGSLFSGGTITQIDNPLTTPTNAWTLSGSLTLAGNGYVTLDTDGTTLVAASNNSGTSDLVQVFNVATGTLNYEANPGDLPGPSRSRIDGATIDPLTGNVWVTSFGSGLPTVLEPGVLVDVSDEPSELFGGSPTGTGFRDLNFGPNGNLYLRGTNGVIGGVRNGTTVDDFTTINSLGATAGFSQIVGAGNVNLQDSFQSAINIELLPASFTGTEDLIISNTRQPSGVLTDFDQQVLAFEADGGFDGVDPFSLNEAGVAAAINFLDTDGVTPFSTVGSANGIYDFSFDPVNEVLWISDQDNGVIYAFGKPGTVTPLDGDANGDGSVDLLDLDILGANFGTMGTGTVATGDFNGDTNVDLLDLDILGANFGATLGGGSAIPEPTACVMLLLAGVGAVVSRRV